VISYNKREEDEYGRYGGYHMGNGYGREINVLRKVNERVEPM
jgi:hypothetical protein